MPQSATKRHSGPSNDVIERRTWDWFSGAVSSVYGPAHYGLLTAAGEGRWPDVVAIRAHSRVGFEITSPLRPEDVVAKQVRKDESSEEEEQPASRQKIFERRVIEALNRKIKKYGEGKSEVPLGLLITLAHPSSHKLYSPKDLPRLEKIVRGHLSNFLHQPIDAVYLVGPGERAHLLWRRRGPKWSKLFPELNGFA